MIPKYYEDDFDFNKLSKTELRKILFDHNIIPPSYSSKKEELIECYKKNFHLKRNLFKKEYEEAIKKVETTKTMTSINLSPDSHSSEELIKNKNKLIKKANTLNSDDIDELTNLLEEIKRDDISINDINEEISTPEALKSYIGSINNNEEVNPYLRTNEYYSESKLFNNEVYINRVSYYNKIYFLINKSYLISKILFIFYLIIKGILLFCPFCLNNKSFLERILNKEVCQNIPNYLIIDKETNLKYKAGFKKNDYYIFNLLHYPLIEDKMTLDIIKSIEYVFIKNINIKNPNPFKMKMKIKSLYEKTNLKFETFYLKNISEYKNIFQFNELNSICNEKLKINFSKEIENFLRSYYLEKLFDLIISDPRVVLKDEEIIIYLNLENILIFYLFEIILFLFLFNFLFNFNFKENMRIKKIVSEIKNQDIKFFNNQELRECYPELTESEWKKIVNLLN